MTQRSHSAARRTIKTGRARPAGPAAEVTAARPTSNAAEVGRPRRGCKVTASSRRREDSIPPTGPQAQGWNGKCKSIHCERWLRQVVHPGEGWRLRERFCPNWSRAGVRGGGRARSHCCQTCCQDAVQQLSGADRCRHDRPPGHKRAINPGTQWSTTAITEQRTIQLRRPDGHVQYTFQAGHMSSLGAYFAM